MMHHSRVIFYRMLNVYEELAEASRRQILGELRSGPKNVSEIVAATGLKQPNVSNHLARMKARGIVRDSKVGRQVYYTLASQEIEAAVAAVFSAPPPAQTDLNLEELAKQFAKAAIAGDEQTCGDLIDAVLRARVPLIDLYQDVLAVAMMHVGTWYKVEAIDEAQEHAASAITERMMARAAHSNSPIRRQERSALLGCSAGSMHVIGIRMLSDYLRLSGWKTVFLGANVPETAFEAAVVQHRPDLVLVSCSTVDQRDETLSLIRRIRGKSTEIVIGVGGGCVQEQPNIFMDAGADFWAGDLRTFANHYLPNIERWGTAEAPQAQESIAERR